jgi:PiT family inorganic phosphate transporter
MPVTSFFTSRSNTPETIMLIFLVVLVAALAFEYINGFHDAANSIATVVSTKVMTPRTAILMAATFELLGAYFLGTAVAKTVGAGLVDARAITMQTIFCALLGAIIWNLFTWRLGLPSSSSHALIGGLCGAALAHTERWDVLIWSKGLWPKVVVPMVVSPAVGFTVGFLLMALLIVGITASKIRPLWVNAVFGKLQIASSMWMALSHGQNDAQKTMGIIALALFTGTESGALDNLPPSLGFLRTPVFEIPKWVVVTCALTMAAGVAAGGWRIIRTMGHKMVRLQPVHGFAAETTAGLVLFTAGKLGIPLSTTHTISTSIMGVGAMKRFGAVKWGIVQRIVWAWVLTMPATGLMGWLSVKGLTLLGWS